MTIGESICRAIRNARKEKGLTHLDLEKKTKISRVVIFAFELGFKGLSFKDVLAIASAVGVTLEARAA